MFDGTSSDHHHHHHHHHHHELHQFMVAATSTASYSSVHPFPMSFPPLHGINPYRSSSLNNNNMSQAAAAAVLEDQQLQLHHQKPQNDNNNINTSSSALVSGGERGSMSMSSSMDDPSSGWSNEEVVALFKARSTVEIWFPDFTYWEHVSRKLGELGFRRSGQQCKRKFEEESCCSRNFNTTTSDDICYNNNSSSSNYRINFSDIEEFYPSDNQDQDEFKPDPKHDERDHQDEDQSVHDTNTRIEESSSGNAAGLNPSHHINEETSEEENVVEVAAKSSNDEIKKKKRKDKKSKYSSERLKVLCEAIVGKMMAKQEELHEKLIEDIVTRDGEKVAREEAKRKQEMDRIQMETEMREKEQALAEERRTTVIHLLNKFITSSSSFHGLDQRTPDSPPTTSTPVFENASQVALEIETNSSSTMILNATSTPQNPSLYPTPSIINAIEDTKSSTPISPTFSKDDVLRDTGKRWPRDEVLALINLRCKITGNNTTTSHGDIDAESINGVGAKAAGGTLWARISQGMMELGYKRSAKRCKEKWENINKYFRKTKDSDKNKKKKRSIHSRTCPYFHHLSSLYDGDQSTLAHLPHT